MDDLLIPKGDLVTAEQMAVDLNLDLYDGTVNDLKRILLTQELDRALSEPGISRELRRLLRARRNGSVN